MYIRFSYQAPTAGEHLVGIAGDFTGWKILDMQRVGDSYQIFFDLAAGRYEYKLIVDGVWMADPFAFKRTQDPFGGENAVIVVAEEEAPISWEEALAEAEKGLAAWLEIHRFEPQKLELRLKWPQHLADEIWVETGGKKKRMYPVGQIGRSRYWHTELDFKGTLELFVRVIYQGREAWLGDGIGSKAFKLNMDAYPLFEIPAWVQEGVIYQIFMDRFANGTHKLNQDFIESYYEGSRNPPPAGEFLKKHQEYFRFIDDWYDVSALKQSPYQAEGIPDWWCFYGGDIAGVISKLDYLEDLGVNILYFNPLWEAKSVHKYDAADFKNIDPHFGTAEELKSLVAEAKKRGMRVILDVAFNHSGESFWAFQDCVIHGEKSRYWHWYDWHKWPLPKPLPDDFNPRDYYQCWWGIKDMPDLNFDLARLHPAENNVRDIAQAQVNWELVNHILEVAEWWLDCIGMDGFRLDVPDEVPWWFWQLFRERVKEIKPEAWLVGEIWHNATAWVSELYFDSVMNYAAFNAPVLNYFIHQIIDQKEFETGILEGLALYPAAAARAMMNLLGSHDTQRIFSLADGDTSSLKQAIFFQMSFIGTPHIYYGDEIGLAGGRDPDNRRPFPWRDLDKPVARELRGFYQELIALRKKWQLLVDGEFEFIAQGAGLLGWRRYDDKSEILCIINRSEKRLEIKKSASEMIFTTCECTANAQVLILAAGAMCMFHN